jgi:hypothetical protein
MSINKSVSPATSGRQTYHAYDPEPRRELVRSVVALAVLFSLFVIIGECVYAAHGDYTKTKELLDELMLAFSGFIGSAIGFYFGGKARQSR